MTKCLKNSRGQFAPIAAMVVFTFVVFIFAVINIYQVAKTKLRLQNIADAIALNLAAREASSLNFIADRNEWLNHLYADPTQNTDPNDPSFSVCPDLSNQKRIPGISCVDSRVSNFSFPSSTGAAGYGRLVQSVNESQMLASQAYDTFLGANGSNSGVGQQALENILLQDIPDLAQDPSIRVITWNSSQNQQNAQSQFKAAKNNPTPYFAGSKSRVEPLMTPLTDALAVQEIKVRYDGKTALGGTQKYGYFSEILGNSTPVGWMSVNQSKLPTLNVSAAGATQSARIGAGAIVLKPLTILGVTFAVSAQSVAYVVPGAGYLPMYSPNQVVMPHFLPTYWVKLVTTHE